jgi:hypothetical protein
LNITTLQILNTIYSTKSTVLRKYPSRETVPIKWKRADVLPDAGGVVHAGQVEGGVLVAPVEGLNAPCHIDK